jgi:transposase, IS5 family
MCKNMSTRSEKALHNRWKNKMIRYENQDQLTVDFNYPFGENLDSQNRWVLLGKMIPWEMFEKLYNSKMITEKGAPAIPARIAIGALIIKHMLNFSDVETIDSIKENPYMQYFLGLAQFQSEQVFTPSLFVAIRKRLGNLNLDEMIKTMASETKLFPEKPKEKSQADDDSKSDHSGMLMIDATVTPADIRFPTDVELLNTSRELTEKIIDMLWAPHQQPGQLKPRTYRQAARKDYLSYSRKRKKNAKLIRGTIRRQLGYIRRNLAIIDNLLGEPQAYPFIPFPLKYRWQRQLWIVREIYRQQKEMFDEKKNNTEDRIVSTSQPHVRPIKRGKSGRPTEFGAKLNASCVNGLFYLDRLSFDNFNESGDFIAQIEAYRERFGHYPESVNADKIYWNRYNRAYCEKNNIKLYGASPLGRPPKKEKSAAEKRRDKKESNKRNQIEGGFGVSKRRFGLDRVMAKTKETSENWIAMTFFVMNLMTILSSIFCHYFARILALRAPFCALNCLREHHFAFRMDNIFSKPRHNHPFISPQYPISQPKILMSA